MSPTLALKPLLRPMSHPQDRWCSVCHRGWLLQGLWLPDWAKLLWGVRPCLECCVPRGPLAPARQHLGQWPGGYQDLQIHLSVSTRLSFTKCLVCVWGGVTRVKEEVTSKKGRAKWEGKAGRFPPKLTPDQLQGTEISCHLTFPRLDLSSDSPWLPPAKLQIPLRFAPDHR